MQFAQPPLEVPNYSEFDAFWQAFKTDVAALDAEAMDGEALAAYVVFPLKDAQYLIGQPDDADGISRQAFIDQIRLIFDEAARQKIAATTAEGLETVDLSERDYDVQTVQATGRVLRVDYQEDDYESTVMYVFGETAEGYQLIAIDLAG